MKPYYQDDHATIYHADARELVPQLAFDVVVTDPPYGIDWAQQMDRGSKKHDGISGDIDTTVRDTVLALIDNDIQKLVFGSPMRTPPKNTKQVLVWQKEKSSGFFGCLNGYRRDFELIYMLGKFKQIPACRSGVIKTYDHLSTYCNRNTHPHAKPIGLLISLIENLDEGVIIDPFMGSGTTLRAAKDLGRKAIGIEIDEQYCEIAARRLAQEVLAL